MGKISSAGSEFGETQHFTYGISDPSSVGYQKRRRMLDIVNNLHNTGVSLDLDLPSIAVIGSQSVGKSSLIESISGINLPRASGTCTRCPIECRLSQTTDPWSARVSIRRVVDAEGHLLDRAEVIPFGPTLFDKTEVEERIRRAQLAILNPTRAVAEFLTIDLDKPLPSLLRFSRNCISLEISGEGVDDLAFVDLPGIISSTTKDGTDKDIEDVEALVAEHISKPSCLILLAITCETDPENQKGRALVKRYDPKGHRTIPVLTKPDRIESGDEGKWLDMLRNRIEVYRHGWYCVKQPGYSELQERIGWEEARQREKSFFESTRPWSALEADIRSRLGTENLSHSLGQKLFSLIAERLPMVEAELVKNLKETRDDLDELPPAISTNPVGEVMSLLDRFKLNLVQIANGSSKDTTRIVQKCTASYEEFAQKLLYLTPRFRPYPESAAASNGATTSLSVGPRRSGSIRSPDNSRSRSRTLMHTGDTDSDDSDDESVSNTRKKEKKEFREFPESLELEEIDSSLMTSEIVYLDQIMDRAKGACTRELPGNYPYSIKPEYMRAYTKAWLGPSEDLVADVEDHIREGLLQIVNEHFKNHMNGGLHATVWSIVEEALSSASEIATERVRHAYEMEQGIPMTLRHRHFIHYRARYLEHYRACYRQASANFPNSPKGGMDFWTRVAMGDEMIDQQLKQIINAFARMGARNVTEADLARLAPPNADEPALEIMAEVRAYYQVAVQRYTDVIPMIVDDALVLAMTTSIPEALLTKLPLSDEDAKARCTELLAQAPDLVAKRTELEGRRSRLEVAREELKKMWTSR